MAAEQLRARHPTLGVLVLSAYAEVTYAARLLPTGAGHVGYLLKDRVEDSDALRDALARIVAGKAVVDPDIVRRLLGRQRRTTAVDELTAPLGLPPSSDDNRRVLAVLTYLRGS